MPRKRVLMVDDSIIVHRKFKELLDADGDFELVGTGKNGIDAIKLYRELKPDILVIDLVMPEMDGFQALRAIMDMDKSASVVVASSLGGDNDTVEKALTIGAKSFITKPMEPESVLRVLRGI